MQDSFRRSTITLPLPTPLTATNSVATYVSPRKQRVSQAQLCLSDTGTGAGATTVNVKVNGTAINAVGSLSVAVGAGSPAVSTTIISGSQYPGGTLLNKGDTVTVDVAAVPGTTVPKLGFLVLDVLEVD
jgi:hypothetical protein